MRERERERKTMGVLGFSHWTSDDIFTSLRKFCKQTPGVCEDRDIDKIHQNWPLILKLPLFLTLFFQFSLPCLSYFLSFEHSHTGTSSLSLQLHQKFLESLEEWFAVRISLPYFTISFSVALHCGKLKSFIFLRYFTAELAGVLEQCGCPLD